MRPIISTDVFVNALNKLKDEDKIPVTRDDKIIAYVQKKDFIIDKDKISMNVKFPASKIESKKNEPDRVYANLHGAVIEMKFDKVDEVVYDLGVLNINANEKIYTCNNCGNSGTAKKMVRFASLVKCSRCGIIIGDIAESAQRNKIKIPSKKK